MAEEGGDLPGIRFGRNVSKGRYEGNTDSAAVTRRSKILRHAHPCDAAVGETNASIIRGQVVPVDDSRDAVRLSP